MCMCVCVCVIMSIEDVRGAYTCGAKLIAITRNIPLVFKDLNSSQWSVIT